MRATNFKVWCGDDIEKALAIYRKRFQEVRADLHARKEPNLGLRKRLKRLSNERKRRRTEARLAGLRERQRGKPKWALR